jgi:ABC-type transport system substrate-binding protein
VRILDVAAHSLATLQFNVETDPLREVDVRRSIVKALDRAAISDVACGAPRCLIADDLTPAPSRSVELPARLELLVLRTDEPKLAAAAVIRHQLHRAGVQVDIVPVSLSELMHRVITRQFEAAVMPLTRGLAGCEYLVSPSANDEISITGYHNPELDRAYAAGDEHACWGLIARDVPIYPLYFEVGFAAVDARFCGDVHPNHNSWAWMAHLYPCSTSESP